MLAAIPVAQVVAWLVVHRFPTRETSFALAIAVSILPGFESWSALATLLSGQTFSPGQPIPLTFWPSLLLTLPTVGVVALAWLLMALPDRGPVLGERPPNLAG